MFLSYLNITNAFIFNVDQLVVKTWSLWRCDPSIHPSTCKTTLIRRFDRRVEWFIFARKQFIHWVDCVLFLSFLCICYNEIVTSSADLCWWIYDNCDTLHHKRNNVKRKHDKTVKIFILTANEDNRFHSFIKSRPNNILISMSLILAYSLNESRGICWIFDYVQITNYYPEGKFNLRILYAYIFFQHFYYKPRLFFFN